jgi:hypothetical protein
MRTRLTWALAFLLSASLLSPGQDKPPRSAGEVARAALADQQRVLDGLKKYTYTKHIVSEQTNMKGKRIGRAERVYSYAPCGERICITLVSVDGATPKPKELKQHEKDMQKEWARQAKLSAAERQKEEDQDTFLSRDFLAVYDFADAPPEPYNGKPTRVVSYKAKPVKVELADKDNKILSKMEGRFWLEEGADTIIASEMHMVKPIKVWGGFAGAINGMNVHTQYVFEQGMYLPLRNEVEIDLRIMLAKTKLKITEEYAGFQAPAPTGAAK